MEVRGSREPGETTFKLAVVGSNAGGADVSDVTVSGSVTTNGMGDYAPYINTSSTRFLTSNSYLSLNDIQVGYNFPKKLIEKIKLNRLNIYVSASNLAILTARKGYNPMTSFTGSSDTHGYSPLSTIMGGIKLSF